MRTQFWVYPDGTKKMYRVRYCAVGGTIRKEGSPSLVPDMSALAMNWPIITASVALNVKSTVDWISRTCPAIKVNESFGAGSDVVTLVPSVNASTRKKSG